MTYGLKFIAGLAALSLVGACASNRGPQPGRGGPPPGADAGMRADLQGGLVAQPVALLFTSIDADANTVLTQAELAAATPSLWRSLDRQTAGNVGAIVYSEWAERHLGAEDALPNRISFDTNLDGAITEAEFTDGLLREFNRLDVNEDTQLTRAELLARMPERQMQPAGGRGGPGGGDGQRPPPPGGRQ